MDGAKMIVFAAVKFILSAFINLGAAIVNIVIWAVNTAIQALYNIPRILLGIIKELIETINNWLGTKISTRWIDNLLKSTDEFRKAWLTIPSINADITSSLIGGANNGLDWFSNKFGSNSSVTNNIVIQQQPGESQQAFESRTGGILQVINAAGVAK
jgi:hypothetical protein